jgi:hypothetical protein
MPPKLKLVVVVGTVVGKLKPLPSSNLKPNFDNYFNRHGKRTQQYQDLP